MFDPTDGGQFAGLREEDQLIDGVLKVGVARLRVHKVIVCGYSPFLRQLFTAGLAESGTTEVELVDVDASPVGALVDNTETAVCEHFLRKKWDESKHALGRPPTGKHAVALMRLVAQVQHLPFPVSYTHLTLPTILRV